MASTRKMGPLVPCGLREESAGLAAASTGLAVAETEGDFGVFFVEGKRRFYQEKSFEFRVFKAGVYAKSATGSRCEGGSVGIHKS